MKLWIGNITPGTTDEEIRAFVAKYESSLECTVIHRVDGDGSRPGATLEFSVAPQSLLETVSTRLNGMFWKERTLFVQVIRSE
jgi:hypothetical protein